MIMSIAHAPVSDATYANVFGKWSDLVVGQRPDGLVDCFLLEADGLVQIAAIWTSREHHDRAVHDEANHPGYSVFEASGIDCTHTVFNVVGRVK